MSKLTDKISYLKGLAEGMKLNTEKDANRLILGIIDALGDLGDSVEAVTEAHGELADYVESIDQDLADMEADLYDDEDEDYAGDDEDEDGDEDGDAELNGVLTYECPHCHQEIELDPESLDLEEDHPCPACGAELFPELPEED